MLRDGRPRTLSAEQLRELLRWNARLTAKAVSDKDFKRIHELGVHRIVLKDCLIEVLQKDRRVA